MVVTMRVGGTRFLLQVPKEPDSGDSMGELDFLTSSEDHFHQSVSGSESLIPRKDNAEVDRIQSVVGGEPQGEWKSLP